MRSKHRDSVAHTRMHRSVCVSAFTLIEILLALSLTTLVIAVTGQIAVQSILTRDEARRIVNSLERDAHLFHQLSNDFANLLHGLPGDEKAVMVFGSQRQVLQLSALSPMPDREGALHVIRRPATIRYRLDGRQCETTGCDLVREVLDRTRAGARAVRETIATKVAGLKIEVLLEDTWVEKFPPSNGQSGSPLAVRVSCRWLEMEASTWTLTIPSDR